MKTTDKKFSLPFRPLTAAVAVLFALCLAIVAPGAHAQTALTQTTLSAAVTLNQNQVTLASVTGIQAPQLPGTPVSVIYVGTEAMGVFNVNTTTKVVFVNRGYLGTIATAHPTADMVLVAPAYQTNLALGGNPMSDGFIQRDPPVGGGCTASATSTTPVLNTLTGWQWLCSTVTGTWVPGWHNPLAATGAGYTATVASAAGLVTPSGPSFSVTGTAAITGFNIPVGFNATAAGGGCFMIHSDPSASWTWTAANNISIAGTGTAKKTFTFCWNPVTSKFDPSAVS